ncbi:MAG: hypothetical protein V3V41_04460 [Candidatus Heimdallarchaeota archaeon]
MSNSDGDDFPLYMTTVNVKEGKDVQLEVVYQGEAAGIDNVLLIGNNNNLESDITKAIVFTKAEKGSSFIISFPIWEDGTFLAVVEKEGKYIYEPGEDHNIVFRGRGIFLDLRKIFHLSKDMEVPKSKVKKKKEEAKVTEEAEISASTDDFEIPAEYDDSNMLTLKPKDFRVFGPQLKTNLLQLLDYLENKKSQQLIFDTVILPDIARSLKQCISEEARASVYEICFPIIIFVEKALIYGGMIHEQVESDERYEKYQKEVLNKINEEKKKIKNTEFLNSTDVIKREYDDDVHELKMRLRKEI